MSAPTGFNKFGHSSYFALIAHRMVLAFLTNYEDHDQDALDAALNAITAEADHRMGHELVPPGTLSRTALRDLKRAEQGR